jgi:hypothetical protein
VALKYEIRRMEKGDGWAVRFRSGAIEHTVPFEGTYDDARLFAASVGLVPDTDAAVFSDYLERRWGLWKASLQSKEKPRP